MPKADVEKWVSEWRDHFDCGYTEDEVSDWVGLDIEVVRNEETFNFFVIGYAKINIASEDSEATQLAVVTDEGKQIPLRHGDKVTVVS